MNLSKLHDYLAHHNILLNQDHRGLHNAFTLPNGRDIAIAITPDGNKLIVAARLFIYLTDCAKHTSNEIDAMLDSFSKECAPFDVFLVDDGLNVATMIESNNATNEQILSLVQQMLMIALEMHCMLDYSELKRAM